MDAARGENVSASKASCILILGQGAYSIPNLGPQSPGLITYREIETESATKDVYFLRIASPELARLLAPNIVVIVLDWLQAGPYWADWIGRCLETVKELEPHPQLIMFAQNYEYIASDPNFMIEDANDALEQYLRTICRKNGATLIYDRPQIDWPAIFDENWAPEPCFSDKLLIPAGQDSREKIMAINSSFPFDEVGHGYIPPSLPGHLSTQAAKSNKSAETEPLNIEDLVVKFQKGVHRVEPFSKQDSPETVAVSSFFDYLNDKVG